MKIVFKLDIMETCFGLDVTCLASPLGKAVHEVNLVIRLCFALREALSVGSQDQLCHAVCRNFC